MSDKDTYSPLELAFGTIFVVILSGPFGVYLGEQLSIPNFAGSALVILIYVVFLGISMIGE